MAVYLVFAVVGFGLVALRLLLGAFYFGGFGKFDESWTRVRTDRQVGQFHLLLAVVTLPLLLLGTVGVGGALARASGWEEPGPLCFGLGMAVLVTVPVPLLNWLNRPPPLRLERALNRTGIVRQTIPANRSGAGSIVVEMLARPVEVLAVTDGSELAEGAEVVVRAVVDDQTVEVFQHNFEEIWRQARPQ